MTRKERRIWWVVGVAAALALTLFIISRNVCLSTWWKYRLVLKECPDGRLRQTVHLAADGLRRGAEGGVNVHVVAHYTTHRSDSELTIPVTDYKVTLALVDAKGQEKALPIDKWKSGNGRVKLPEVPDGDYKLRARVKSRLGEDTVDAPLALYTPARVHVITDRPLYEPGNTVRFRAVVLRARDLAPLDGRPGRWEVIGPSGENLLEEKAAAGDWGVVAGSFPLDREAETGRWQVRWISDVASDTVAFTVEPFVLPRFRVEAAPKKPFYRPGESPVVEGKVVYSSGAPVAGAKLDIQWNANTGDWPPPTEWLETTLPKRAETGANGRFSLSLPQIPSDLSGQGTLSARIAAVDPAGDRVEGGADVLMAKDGITVSAVTELGDGLVDGFNNRMYLRVATADGQILPGTKIRVQRAWSANDPGIDAQTDEDGVASLQIDPGPAVNVVIPPPPVRPPPKRKVVTRDEPQELIFGESAPLVDQVEMDKWVVAVEPCAKWVDSDGQSTQLGIRADGGGALVTVAAAADDLDKCVAAVVRGRRLPAGGERLYTLQFHFLQPDLSSVAASVSAALEAHEDVEKAFDRAAKDSRDCLPQQNDGELPRAAFFQGKAGAKEVDVSWISDPHGESVLAGAAACLVSRMPAKITLSEPAESDTLGIVHFTLSLPERIRQMTPQATTMLGYELLITAEQEGKPSTKLRVQPGQVPNLRMRVAPILAKGGDSITAELIRGPDYNGKLPEELQLTWLKGHDKARLDPDSHKATFAIPTNAEGWLEVTGAGLRGLVYIKPQGDLAVTVKPDHDTYKPGATAQLSLSTTIGGRGAPAAVGLFGVDESLGQLVPLSGPGDMARLRPQVGTSTPAFGVLDGQALAQGRIRGANAAAATVLRVSSIPTPPEVDAVASARGQTSFDPIEELTDRFYTVLAELHVQARFWEAQAPKDEKMKPATMAKLWQKALDACVKRGEKVDDAYGRRMRLSQLPPDLLALTDPRQVIVTGTRLPEDVENWSAWVKKEKP